MILIGQYDSSFVRRVGIAARIYEFDFEIAYGATGFDTRNYYINNIISNFSTLDNPYDVNLTLLSSGLSTGILFTVQDGDGNPIEGYTLYIDRYDLATDTYSLVSMVNTNDEGEAYANLEMYTVDYRIKVYDGVTLKKTVPKTKITSTTVTITVGSSELTEVLEYFGDISYTFEYTNATNKFELDWTDPNSEVDNHCMKIVILRTQNGTGTVYDSCSSAASGTLTHTIGIGNTGTYIATYYVIEGSYEQTIAQITQTIGVTAKRIGEALGVEGVFAAFMLIGTMAFAGITTPVIAIVFLLVGLIAAAFMGLIVSLNTYALVIGICLVGVIIIAKIKT